MSSDDSGRDAALFAELALLKIHDVNPQRAERLRRRCHRALRLQEEVSAPPASLWSRTVGPALAAAWCVVYLVEVIRRAAANYGF